MQKITDIQDALLRSILIEQAKTSKKYTKNLGNFIAFRLPQKDLINLIERKFYLKEAFLSTDIEREQFIDKLTTPLQIMSTLSIAVLAAGGGDNKNSLEKGIEGLLSKTKMSMLDPTKHPKRSSYIYGAILTWIIGQAGFILSRAIKILLKKAFLICRRNCERSIPENKQNISNRKILVEICTLKCRLSGMETVLSKLQSQAAICNTTKNPWRCKSTIFTKIGQIQDDYQRDKQRLQELINLSKKSAPHFMKKPPYNIKKQPIQPSKKD